MERERQQTTTTTLSSNKTNEMKKQQTKGRKTHIQIKEISGKS